MKKHIDVVHLNEGKYKCDSCNKSFAIKCMLTKHVDSVHKKLKPHQCFMCDEAYSYPVDLRKHKKRCHFQEESQTGNCI